MWNNYKILCANRFHRPVHGLEPVILHFDVDQRVFCDIVQNDEPAFVTTILNWSCCTNRDLNQREAGWIAESVLKGQPNVGLSS